MYVKTKLEIRDFILTNKYHLLQKVNISLKFYTYSNVVHVFRTYFHSKINNQ